MLAVKNTINSIQALRGIAALLVVGFHYREALNLTFPTLGDTLFINGAIGVDLFFLISGFITFYVANNLNDGLSSSLEFIVKRICRVIPLYYIILLLSPGNTLKSLYEVGRSLLFIPLDGSQTGPMYGYASILVGWTLNYEMLFYALAAIAIACGRWKWAALITIIAGLTFIPALLFGWHGLNTYIGYPFENTYLKLATNPMLLEFLFGVFIGYVYTFKSTAKHRLVWSCLLASGAGFFIYCYATGFMWGNKPLGWMIPSFFLLLSLVEYEKRFPVVWPKCILFAGEISFSVYLLHTKLYNIVEKILKRTPIFDWDYYGLILVAVAFVLSILVSALTYKYIEIALSNKLKTFLLKGFNTTTRKVQTV